MAVDVRPAVLVRRPRGDVAAFMFDPGNDLRWTGGITASRPAQPGPLVAGASPRTSNGCAPASNADPATHAPGQAGGGSWRSRAARSVR
jgi:hypothetical protein